MPIFNTERDKLLISGDKHTIGYNHTNTVLAREMAATYSVCTRNGRNMLYLAQEMAGTRSVKRKSMLCLKYRKLPKLFN